MLVLIKHNILIALCKLNVVYPKLLGFGYLYYKNVFLKNNFKSYNPEQKLLKVVNTAIKNVPYYRSRYKEINSLSDFRNQIDFIDKDEVMGNWEDFIALGTSKSKIITGTTGGTSGKPLKLVIPKNRYIFELGTMYTMWENVGWKGQIRAVLRNTKLEDNKDYIVNPVKREFIFDGFRTSDSYYDMVYQTMKKHKIKYLHAYPSSAYQFAVFLKNKGYDTSIFNAFLCGSEGLLPEQKSLIIDQLGINVYHWYGHSEKLVLGGYCKGNKDIHIEPTYGFFELIDTDGNIINESNKKGEIIGTTLHNKYMPLIRYRTGDYAEYVGDYCKDCGRHLALVKNTEGRWDTNRIYYKDKSYTSITALNLHGDLYTHISGMQYVQDKSGQLIIKLIKDKSFSNQVEKRFFEFFEKTLGENCDFEIQYVDELVTEKNGKFLPLKQNIKN